MANTLDQRILGLIKKYMEKLVQKKVLTSMEEVEANTNGTNLVAAPVVAELNNKLSGFEPVLDATGKITGYKTDIGGADTVFPFSCDVKLIKAIRIYDTTTTTSKLYTETYTLNDESVSNILVVTVIQCSGTNILRNTSVTIDGVVPDNLYRYNAPDLGHGNLSTITVYQKTKVSKGSVIKYDIHSGNTNVVHGTCLIFSV